MNEFCSKYQHRTLLLVSKIRMIIFVFKRHKFIIPHCVIEMHRRRTMFHYRDDYLRLHNCIFIFIDNREEWTVLLDPLFLMFLYSYHYSNKIILFTLHTLLYLIVFNLGKKLLIQQKVPFYSITDKNENAIMQS